MKDLSFSSGGISLNFLTGYPERARTLPFPESIIIPLKHDHLNTLIPKVKKNLNVNPGDVLASSSKGNILSPVKGKVVEVLKDFKSHLGTKCQAVEIEVQDNLKDIKYNFEGGILEGIIKSGIIDGQERVVSLASKIEIAQKNKVDTLIINGLEEIIPHGKTYYFLQKRLDIVKDGIHVLLKILNLKRIFLALYSDYKKIEGFCDKLNKNLGPLGIEIVFLKNKYPQHRTPLLVKSILNKHMELDKKVEESLRLSVINLDTIYQLGLLKNGYIPYREKVITVVKGDLENTELIETTLGTPISEVIKHLDIDINSIKKIVINGTISGKSIFNMDYPITKDMEILFLVKDINQYSDSVCIKCGLCVEVCPMDLLPLFISGYSQSKKFELTKKYYIDQCIECGCCAYVCPVHIPLVQWIQYGKSNIRKL